MAWQVYVAKFLDLGFSKCIPLLPALRTQSLIFCYCVTAIGFGTLAVLYPIIGLADDKFSGLDPWIVEGYYVFFTLFFLGILIKQRHIHEYCAFVNSLWIKSLFYIFCASLGFA